MQQQQQQQRPSNLNHSHSYSRSSPGAMEQQKYKPFSNTPEQNKYAAASNNYAPQTPQGPPSYSPLGLADIRPRADTTLSDSIPFSPAAGQDTDIMQYPTSSNYVAQWPIYAVDWCKWPPRTNAGAAGKVAIGSYLEDGHNYIQVLDASVAPMDPENPMADRAFEFTKTAEATHAYPVTRILWEPPSSNKQTTDLLATSGDHLRLWSLPADTSAYSNSISRKDQPMQKLSPLALLSNSKSPEHTAPITSLDWNVVQPSLIITSSIDTTCTIWDIPTLTAKTQLIAHDKEVYDVR
jgi:DDB1- and CUL4-associated factor 7